MGKVGLSQHLMPNYFLLPFMCEREREREREHKKHLGERVLVNSNG